MRFYLFIFWPLIIVIITTSCLRKSESIKPISDIRTLAELQKETMMNTAIMASGNNKISKDAAASIEQNPTDPSIFYLNLKYNIKNMDLYETANIPNSFEQIGNSFLKAFVKIFLRITGDRTIQIGNVDLPIPDLNLDFDIVKSLNVKRVYIEFNKEYDKSTGNKANFAFVKEFSLSRINGPKPKLITYSKTKNKCMYKCLSFDIIDGNIFEMVKESNILKLKPNLKIISFPAVDELKIDGQIDLQFGLKLPF